MALTSVSNVKTKLGISGTGEDTLLTALVAQADAMIKRWCDRAIESATFTEYPQGYGSRMLRLQEQPVTSITSVYVDSQRQFAASTLLDASQYTLVNNALIRVGGVWPASRENRFGLLYDAQVPSVGVIKVTYVAGYVTVPSDIVAAADMLVARLYAMRQTGDLMQSENLEDYGYARGSDAGTNGDILRSVRGILAPYRRLRI